MQPGTTPSRPVLIEYLGAHIPLSRSFQEPTSRRHDEPTANGQAGAPTTTANNPESPTPTYYEVIQPTYGALKSILVHPLLTRLGQSEPVPGLSADFEPSIKVHTVTTPGLQATFGVDPADVDALNRLNLLSQLPKVTEPSWIGMKGGSEVNSGSLEGEEANILVNKLNKAPLLWLSVTPNEESMNEDLPLSVYVAYEPTAKPSQAPAERKAEEHSAPEAEETRRSRVQLLAVYDQEGSEPALQITSNSSLLSVSEALSTKFGIDMCPAPITSLDEFLVYRVAELPHDGPMSQPDGTLKTRVLVEAPQCDEILTCRHLGLALRFRTTGQLSTATIMLNSALHPSFLQQGGKSGIALASLSPTDPRIDRIEHLAFECIARDGELNIKPIGPGKASLYSTKFIEVLVQRPCKLILTSSGSGSSVSCKDYDSLQLACMAILTDERRRSATTESTDPSNNVNEGSHTILYLEDPELSLGFEFGARCVPTNDGASVIYLQLASVTLSLV